MVTNTVDQSRLVLNAFASVFQNNLLAADLVEWKKYDTEYDPRNGFQISEQVGPRYIVNQTSGGVADLTSGVQDSSFGSELFTINDTFNTSMGWTDFAAIKDIGDARKSVALRNAATQMAEKIDGYILGLAALAANNEVGTAGNNVATYADVLSAYTRLKKEGVDDADLRMVLAYDDKQALGTSVVAYTATDSLSTQTFRKGFEGEIAGLPTMFTQQLSAITPGTRTNGTVSGGAQNVSYASVCKSTTANGRYMTQTINLAGLGAAATIKDGEVFTIATVFAWDNRKQQILPHLQQFRVVGDVTADGAGAASVRIFPAIIIADTNNNSAHRTVNIAPAGGAVVTFRGTASTAYTPRVLIQKQAITIASANLLTPYTDTIDSVNLTKVPVNVRMWSHSDFNTGAHSIRFDCCLTGNVRDRRRIVRLNGA